MGVKSTIVDIYVYYIYGIPKIGVPWSTLGIPKSSIFIGLSIINQPAIGVPLFMENPSNTGIILGISSDVKVLMGHCHPSMIPCINGGMSISQYGYRMVSVFFVYCNYDHGTVHHEFVVVLKN